MRIRIMGVWLVLVVLVAGCTNKSTNTNASTSAVASSRFKGFSIEPVSEELCHLGSRKIVAWGWGTRPLGKNTMIRAWVGDQEIVGINIDQFGLSFAGYVANVPNSADTLKYELPGGAKTDTGLTAIQERGSL